MELICFTKELSEYLPDTPEYYARKNHWWASKKPGWIDYSFLGDPKADPPLSEVINGRAVKDGSGIHYLAETPGGRRQPDGELLEWVITAPPSESRGTVPFFCGDVTPRERRVSCWLCSARRTGAHAVIL